MYLGKELKNESMKIIDNGYCGDNEYLFKILILDDISQNVTNGFIAENDI